MRHPTAFIVTTLAVLLLIAGCQTVSRDGQGTYTYANGSVYVGEFRNGKRHGEGTYTYGPKSKSAGTVYVGGFRDNEKHGQGTLTLANGHVYAGEFRNDTFNGQGTFTLADGSVYVGEFRNNKKHGQGTSTSADGIKYVGEWKDSKMHGQGTATDTYGKLYVGEFRDNRPNGKGTHTYANGGKYVGEFRDGLKSGQGTETSADGRVREGVWKNDEFKYARKASPKVYADKTPTPKANKKPETEPSPEAKSGTSGSGFFVSKLGHVVTNEHVVRECKTITVGDNANKQVSVEVIETDRRNDLALLKLSSTSMASAETKSLISKLGIQISSKAEGSGVPLSSNGLLRSEDVELGEDVLVGGYPYGDIFSNTIKVTKGIVSAIRGMGDDSGQFQMDAAVQAGNSGGPIYDENGNIVGVVISQLNKLKVAKAIGSMPENVNFGIKASTVRQFLTSSGLPTKWSERSQPMSTIELAKIAKSQTVMVVCNQ